ncbi:DUF6920 family protein [Halobium salinum]|uniref:DUF6920 family protein n=1 Tax=Halobium salinum TaxID=1364940 RepID=A0ABD5PBA4_9EURY|nr:DUF6544 family protein [Halobium salinum]
MFRTRLGARHVGVALVGIGGVLGAVRFRSRRGVRKCRRSLRAERAGDESFDPGSVSALPAPARRYLEHAIDPGRPLARRVELTMAGEFRFGDRWCPFEAEETLAARRGFLWEPTVRLGPGLWFSGVDFYVDGEGGQRFFLDGLLPVVRAGGPAVDRSSAGRFLAESVWLPTSLLPAMGAEWETVDDDRARVSLPGVDEPLTLTVGGDGALRSVKTMRLDGGTGERRPFGAVVESERTVDGVTVPWEVEVGWETEAGEFEPFFRAELREAAFG